MDLARVALTTARTMVDQHLPSLGVTIPKPYRDDLAAVDRMLARLDRIAPDRRATALAVAAALEDDRDPATDPAVLAALAREQLQALNAAAAVAQVGDERRAAAIAKHGPAIIASMVPVVDAADHALRQAHDRLPNLDLGDVHYVTRLPPQSMALWGAARDALARVDRVAVVWQAVVRAAGLTPLEPRSPYLPLILAPLDADALAALPDRTPTAPAHAGHRLALATVDSYRQRVATVQAQQTRAARPGAQHDEEPTNDEPKQRRRKAGAASS
jgi:hypothetical protein